MTNPIVTTEALIAFCDKLSNQPFITVDTEFLRERTYFPELCLVQVAGGDDVDLVAAIDPLAHGIDLEPLFVVLQNPNIVKVMHSAKQDIEIFYNLSDGRVPTPLFDTQVAAMVCGMGEQIGYEAIVGQLLDVSINKAQQFTDWSRRPLSNEQLEYAIADVTHLRDVYRILIKDKIPAERLAWINIEIEKNLTNSSLYSISPEDSWQRMKNKTTKPAYLTRLQALCSWREKRAISENKPRGWVLHDDAIQEIASTNPSSIDKLKAVRAIKRHRGGLVLEDVLAVIKTANSVPASERPTKKRRKRFPSELEPARDFLKLILKQQAETNQMAVRFIASQDDLSNFLMGDKAVEFMKGWRYELFGRYVEASLAGEVSVALNKKGDLSINSKLL